MFTALMLLVTSVAQYALDKDTTARANTAGVLNPERSLVVTPDARKMVAEELPESPARGRKISQMIFRIN